MLINQDFEGYDIIGDVHGCAQALSDLLNELGYVLVDGVFRYRGIGRRQVIFLGDLIDRGPDIMGCLKIARAMVEAGTAQMIIGNHEFNLLAYFTPVKEGFLRARNERSTKQIKATLEAFEQEPGALEDYLQWFSQLPLFLEFDSFRVVHACWDQTRIHAYYHHYGTRCLTQEAVSACDDYSSIAAQAIERVTRGLSLKLPDGLSIIGRDGFRRHSFRVRFWAEQYQCYDDIVFQPDPLPESIRYRELDDAERGRLIHYDKTEKPLFVGHYWLRGEPELVASNIACLDYSAVNQGQLVAYRFDVETKQLSNENFVVVDCS